MKRALTALLILLVISCGKKSTSTDTSTSTTVPTTTTTDTSTVDYSYNSGSTVSIAASPSAAVTLGNTILLTGTVNGISDPVYNFYFISGGEISGVSASQNGNVASVSSTANATVVLGVAVKSKANSANQATSQITLQFGSGSSTSTTSTTTTTSTTALVCNLTHTSSSPYRYGNINFYINSNTGEQLRLISWDPGEGWDTSAPTFPYSLSMQGSLNYFYGYYTSVGLKNVRVVAESVSRPGVYCNAGAALTDYVFINY